MSVTVEVAVSADDFLLTRALTVDSSARITLETVVPLGAAPFPYLRIESDRLELLRDLVAADPAVDRVDVLQKWTDSWMVEVKWRDSSVEFLDVLRDTGAVCDAAVAADGTWQFSLQFSTHDRLSEWYRACTSRGIRVDVGRIGDRGTLDAAGAPDQLTDPQREALRVALDAGYFSVPREVTLEELAARLGISDTATSQRLRRGVRNVLTASFDSSDPGRIDGQHSAPR